MPTQQVIDGIKLAIARIHRSKDFYGEEGTVMRVHILNDFWENLLWHGINIAVSGFTRHMRSQYSTYAGSAMDILCQELEADTLDDLIALCIED